MNKETIERLAEEESKPCVTISLNTHRTKPDYLKDRIVLKNLCKEAQERIINEFGKRPVKELLEKLENIPEDIDLSLNLDSLHIFISNHTKEIIKSSWPTRSDKVHISNRFALRPLIYAINRTDEYLILLLSQSGVQLFLAQNDKILYEISDNGFPFDENIHFHTDPLKVSDPKAVDNMVREFLNKVDKALQKVTGQIGIPCIVISTEDNYSRLMQVADNQDLYNGFANINYNNTANHYISSQAWEIIKEMQKERVFEAIREIQKAIPQEKVYTDLQKIYSAAREGRGELLMASFDFSQAVKMKDEYSFEPVQDVTLPDIIDDITGNIAWEVVSKNGRALFTHAENIAELGSIILKVRY